VGPVSVTAESKSVLQALLAGGLFVILVLSGLLVALVLRLGRIRRQVAQEPPPADPDTGTL
jgi:hypothetical protein